MAIVTYTGKYFDFNNIKEATIDIDDILHALPRINRFVGHSSRAYSVGEHTLRGLAIARESDFTELDQFHWLIHDFTEAYVGDCPSPLKAVLPEYQRIEAEVSKAIYKHLGVNKPREGSFRDFQVHRIDKTMLLLEMRDLTLHDHMQHVNDLILADVLDNPNFAIHNSFAPNTKHMTHTLKQEFEYLLGKVKP